MNIRLAVKEDAMAAAELIYLAIDDIAEKLTGETEPEKILSILSLSFQKEKNRLSYENSLIADIDGMVAGILVAYAGDESEQLDQPFLESLRKKTGNPHIRIVKEADDGDYYLDTLCVKADYQGRGIGTALILEAEKAAMKKGISRVSLNVAHDNSKAKVLYSRIGYKKEKVIQINGHNYDYMVKKL